MPVWSCSGFHANVAPTRTSAGREDGARAPRRADLPVEPERQCRPEPTLLIYVSLVVVGRAQLVYQDTRPRCTRRREAKAGGEGPRRMHELIATEHEQLGTHAQRGVPGSGARGRPPVEVDRDRAGRRRRRRAGSRTLARRACGTRDARTSARGSSSKAGAVHPDGHMFAACRLGAAWWACRPITASVPFRGAQPSLSAAIIGRAAAGETHVQRLICSTRRSRCIHSSPSSAARKALAAPVPPAFWTRSFASSCKYRAEHGGFRATSWSDEDDLHAGHAEIVAWIEAKEREMEAA